MATHNYLEKLTRVVGACTSAAGRHRLARSSTNRHVRPKRASRNREPIVKIPGVEGS